MTETPEAVETETVEAPAEPVADPTVADDEDTEPAAEAVNTDPDASPIP